MYGFRLAMYELAYSCIRKIGMASKSATTITCLCNILIFTDVKMTISFIFLKTQIVGVRKNCLSEAILTNTHTMFVCFDCGLKSR